MDPWRLMRTLCMTEQQQIFRYYSPLLHKESGMTEVTPWTVASQASLFMGFSRREYYSVWPWPPPGDLSEPGIKLTSLMSPALAGEFFTTSATWEVLKDPIGEKKKKKKNLHFWGLAVLCSLYTKFSLFISFTTYQEYNFIRMIICAKRASQITQW